MRSFLRIPGFVTLLLAVALIASGCGSDKNKDGKNKEAEEPENESTEAAEGEAEPTGPSIRPRKVEGKPQKDLTVLIRKGKRQIQGYRGERGNIYEYFNTLGKNEVNAVKGLIRDMKNFRFDERPERLKAAPEKIHGFIVRLFALAKSSRAEGEDSILRHEQKLSEHNTGAKRHTQKAIDLEFESGQSQIKLSDYCALLARNLVDEAIIYARYGSQEMQDAMKEIFKDLEGQGPPLEVLQMKLHILLWLVRVDGVDKPEL